MERHDNYLRRKPFYKSVMGSTESPGVIRQDWYGNLISTYDIITVEHDEMLVIKYLSAGVIRALPYPIENKNDLGSISFETNDGNELVHTIPFERSEPGGILHTNQLLSIYIPSSASLRVSVPIIENQSGGARIDVSGYVLML